MTVVPDSFEILYEQGPCLVVNKPGGVLTQAPVQIDSMERRIKEFLKQRDQKTGRVYLGVPHRLDRPVSGALIVAKHQRAARRIAEQFQGRMVRKTYWALVDGCLTEKQGSWRDYVRKLPDEAKSEVVDAQHPEGRHAVLHYRVLARTELFSWLQIELETGRTHQIRLQAAERGVPIMGDELYGSSARFGPPTDDPRQRWIALHARQLEFRHPMTQEKIRIESPLPPAWQAFATALGTRHA